MVKNGATTLWELWQNKTGPSMNSHNHPMFGSVGLYLYRSLAGINLGKDSAGYKTIRIEPQVFRDLTLCCGLHRNHQRHGRILLETLTD